MTSQPLYERVRQTLVEQIARGDFGPGDRLPSESQLAADLGVNRLTVRRAIEELARAGMVRSRQGSGTFVTGPIFRMPLSQRLSTDRLVATMTEQIAAQGHTYEDVLLGVTPVRSADMGLGPGPKWRIDNAIVVDGEAWVWSQSWIDRAVLDDPASGWSTTTGLYGQLNEALGELSPVWREILADAATRRDSEVLGILPGSPVLVREGLTADASGRPVLRVQRRSRMDRLSYLLSY